MQDASKCSKNWLLEVLNKVDVRGVARRRLNVLTIYLGGRRGEGSFGGHALRPLSPPPKIFWILHRWRCVLEHFWQLSDSFMRYIFTRKNYQLPMKSYKNVNIFFCYMPLSDIGYSPLFFLVWRTEPKPDVCIWITNYVDVQKTNTVNTAFTIWRNICFIYTSSNNQFYQIKYWLLINGTHVLSINRYIHITSKWVRFDQRCAFVMTWVRIDFGTFWPGCGTCGFEYVLTWVRCDIFKIWTRIDLPRREIKRMYVFPLLGQQGQRLTVINKITRTT